MTVKTPAAWLTCAALFLVLAACVSAESRAGERSGFFGLGIHGNYYSTGDADDGTIRGGLQVRLRLTDGIAIEGAADYREEEFDDGHVTVEGYPFQAGSTLSASGINYRTLKAMQVLKQLENMPMPVGR